MEKIKSIYASAYSSVITIVGVVVLTVWSELSTPFKDWLASFTGHHWLTKSWASIIVFALFFIIFRFNNVVVTPYHARKALVILEVFVVLGFVAILGFDLYVFLES